MNSAGQFYVAGCWAIDESSPLGTGIDLIHVHATQSGGSPVVLGAATYGSARPDIATLYSDSRFTNSGFTFTAHVPPGPSTLTVYARNASTGVYRSAPADRRSLGEGWSGGSCGSCRVRRQPDERDRDESSATMINLRRPIAWALAASVGAGVAAQERGVAIPAAVRETQGVLVAAFPELREGRVTWRITTTATAPVVAAAVTVDEQGRVQALETGGTLVEQARAKAATRSRDADADLRAVDAKFPPSEVAAHATLVPVGLQRQLGTAAVRETTFRAEGPAEGAQDARTWRVELDTDDPTGRPYTLVFEPVEGRLLSVVRR